MAEQIDDIAIAQERGGTKDCLVESHTESLLKRMKERDEVNPDDVHSYNIIMNAWSNSGYHKVLLDGHENCWKKRSKGIEPAMKTSRRT